MTDWNKIRRILLRLGERAWMWSAPNIDWTECQQYTIWRRLDIVRPTCMLNADVIIQSRLLENVRSPPPSSILPNPHPSPSCLDPPGDFTSAVLRERFYYSLCKRKASARPKGLCSMITWCLGRNVPQNQSRCLHRKTRKLPREAFLTPQ